MLVLLRAAVVAVMLTAPFVLLAIATSKAVQRAHKATNKLAQIATMISLPHSSGRAGAAKT